MQGTFYFLLFVLRRCLSSVSEQLVPISLANEKVTTNFLRKYPSIPPAAPKILSEASLPPGMDIMTAVKHHKLTPVLNIPAIPPFLKDLTFPPGLPPIIADLTLPPGLPPVVEDLTFPPGGPNIPWIPPILKGLTLPPGLPPIIADLTMPPGLPFSPAIPPIAPALMPVLKPALAPFINHPIVWPVSTLAPTAIPSSYFGGGSGSQGSMGLHSIGEIIGVTIGIVIGAICVLVLVYLLSSRCFYTKSGENKDDKLESLVETESSHTARAGSNIYFETKNSQMQSGHVQLGEY